MVWKIDKIEHTEAQEQVKVNGTEYDRNAHKIGDYIKVLFFFFLIFARAHTLSLSVSCSLELQVLVGVYLFVCIHSFHHGSFKQNGKKREKIMNFRYENVLYFTVLLFTAWFIALLSNKTKECSNKSNDSCNNNMAVTSITVRSNET